MADDLFEIIDAPAPAKGAAAAGDPTTSVIVRLHVQPGAGHAAVVGRYGDALHVRVAPPPADGRANVAVEALIAELFDVAKSAVTLVSGDHSRDKRVRVEAVSVDLVRQAIDEALAEATTGAGRRGARGRSGR